MTTESEQPRKCGFCKRPFYDCNCELYSEFRSKEISPQETLFGKEESKRADWDKALIALYKSQKT